MGAVWVRHTMCESALSGLAASAAAERCLSPPEAVTLRSGWATGATRSRSVDTSHSKAYC